MNSKYRRLWPKKYELFTDATQSFNKSNKSASVHTAQYISTAQNVFFPHLSWINKKNPPLYLLLTWGYPIDNRLSTNNRNVSFSYAGDLYTEKQTREDRKWKISHSAAIAMQKNDIDVIAVWYSDSIGAILSRLSFEGQTRAVITLHIIETALFQLYSMSCALT